MDSYIDSIVDHMKFYSCSILGKCLYESTFSDMMRPFIHTLSLIEAAQGAELMLKSIIARTDFRYIFRNPETIPLEIDDSNIEDLFNKGRTVGYFELPNLLEKTTGYSLRKLEFYLEFGVLRNGLVHFMSPSKEYSDITLRFILEVLDPIAWDFWNETFIEESVIWDDVIISEGYLLDAIERKNIQLHQNSNILIDRLTEYRI